MFWVTAYKQYVNIPPVDCTEMMLGFKERKVPRCLLSPFLYILGTEQYGPAVRIIVFDSRKSHAFVMSSQT